MEYTGGARSRSRSRGDKEEQITATKSRAPGVHVHVELSNHTMELYIDCDRVDLSFQNHLLLMDVFVCSCYLVWSKKAIHAQVS